MRNGNGGETRSSPPPYACTRRCKRDLREEEEREEEGERRASVAVKMEKEAHTEIVTKKEAYAERGRVHHEREGERGEEERRGISSSSPLCACTHAQEIDLFFSS